MAYGPTVSVQHNTICCPRRGTMRLHSLRGMKAEVMCIAFICIHELYRWYSIFFFIIEAPTCSYVLTKDLVLYTNIYLLIKMSL
jgi:hypothetical protein